MANKLFSKTNQSLKKWVLPACMVWMSASSRAQQYVPVDSGSAVTFKIKNFGFTVSGSFSGLAGNIRFEPDNLSVCSFDVSLNANSINTDINMRDNHLRNSDYFDVKNYPRIHFVSSRVTAAARNGEYIIFGKLTIKNQTRDISFPFSAVTFQDNYRFKGSFKLNRKDFEIGGSSTISDNLDLSLDVLAKIIKK